MLRLPLRLVFLVFSDVNGLCSSAMYWLISELRLELELYADVIDAMFVILRNKKRFKLRTYNKNRGWVLLPIPGMKPLLSKESEYRLRSRICLRKHCAGRLLQYLQFRCLQLLVRSEEHTSELQSQSNLVCRL